MDRKFSRKFGRKPDKITLLFAIIYTIMFCLGVNYMIRYYVSFSVPAVAYATLAAVSLAAAYAVLKGIYALTAKSGGTTTGRNPHGCALNAALRSDF